MRLNAFLKSLFLRRRASPITLDTSHENVQSPHFIVWRMREWQRGKQTPSLPRHLFGFFPTYIGLVRSLSAK